MKYLKRFNKNISIYSPDWEQFLPETLVILKGQKDGIDRHVYKKGNVMLNADMIQISYVINEWMVPDTLEIDIYLVKDTSKEKKGDSTTVKGSTLSYDKNYSSYIPNLRLNIDITYGDQMACEFTISKDGVIPYQTTSYGSKFDPTDTLFAIEEDSLSELVDFLNRFNHGVELNNQDFYFLRENK